MTSTVPVRVFIVFCLVFFVVWAFRMFLFCCCLGGGVGPAQTAKKNTTQNNKKK